MEPTYVYRYDLLLGELFSPWQACPLTICLIAVEGNWSARRKPTLKSQSGTIPHIPVMMVYGKKPIRKKAHREKSPSRKAHQEKSPSAEVMGWKKAHHFLKIYLLFYTNIEISILIYIHDIHVKTTSTGKTINICEKEIIINSAGQRLCFTNLSIHLSVCWWTV